MPSNTLRVHTEYVLVKSVGPKVLWAKSQVQGTGEYFPPLQSNGEIVEVEIGGAAIYLPFGEFHRAKSYCHPPVWGSRQRPTTGVHLAPMNFVGLDLTMSDRWHEQQQMF
ncbi:uncharacterized protein TNCV_3064171 [Trichonephila clavipes]|nr:uncharacterized protein TNCV_3064171 [Trichonephila clavipes]